MKVTSLCSNGAVILLSLSGVIAVPHENNPIFGGLMARQDHVHCDRETRRRPGIERDLGGSPIEAAHAGSTLAKRENYDGVSATLASSITFTQ